MCLTRTVKLFQLMPKHDNYCCSCRFFGIRIRFYSENLRYPAVDSQKVLDLFNKSDDLSKYGIKKTALSSLMQWKSSNGVFKNIGEILALPGFNEKLIAKVVDASKKSVSKVSNGKSKSVILTTPNVLGSSVGSIKSCVALHIAAHSISWSRIEINEDRPCNLTHWDHYDYMSRKKHLHELVKECLYVDHLVPDANCYVIENPQMAQTMYPGSAKQINLNAQHAQIIGIVSFALMKRSQSANESEKINQVYFLRKYLTSRLFKTLIGTERVSTQSAVIELLRTHYNIEDRCGKNENGLILAAKGNISVPSNLREMYDASEGYQKDFLGQSLLLGLTFIRLCLLKCPKSLSKINL